MSESERRLEKALSHLGTQCGGEFELGLSNTMLVFKHPTLGGQTIPVSALRDRAKVHLMDGMKGLHDAEIALAEAIDGVKVHP